MSRTTKPATPAVDRISLVVDTYVSSIQSYIEAHSLNRTKAIQAILKRPNAVRVGKIASFQISGVPVNQLFSTEDIYTITNRVYNQFNRVIEPDVSGVTNDTLLAQLRG